MIPCPGGPVKAKKLPQERQMPLPGELLPGEGYVPSAGPLYQSAAGQAEAHRNGVVHPLHHRAVHPAHPLPQAAFVQGADLLQQDHGILGQTAALGRHLDVGGQLGLAHLGGDGRRDDGGAVAVAGVVLHDQHRAHAPLLAAHHRAQVGIINFAALDIRIHKRSHSAGRSTRKKRVTFILPRSPGIYTRFSRPASFYGAAGGGVRQNRSSSSRSVTCPFCKYTRGTRLLTAQVSS